MTIESLTYIMNMSLQMGVFPNEWKIAKVVPLHKGGDLNDVNNYRPISILACVSKCWMFSDMWPKGRFSGMRP